MTDLLFVVFFMLVAPPAIAVLAKDITEEEIGSPIRAFVESRFPMSMLSYLVNCPVCMSHWTGFLVTSMCCGVWANFTLCNGLVAALLCWAASVRLTTRFWLHE